MRDKLIGFLKRSPFILQVCWKSAKYILICWRRILKKQPKTIIFSSFGGRKFDDSPKAIYDEICSRQEFNDYKLVWAFVEPEKFELQRGEKVRIDTYEFFKTLLKAGIWVGNSEIDRGIGLHFKDVLSIETWHGTPLKKIGGEENQNTLGGKVKHSKKKDSSTIRCAQSDFDKEIFARIFDADENSILLTDLPRNDKLFRYSSNEIEEIKRNLNIPNDKKVILYTPTYREFLVDSDNENYIAPPIDLKKWQNILGSEYVFLIRAHYAVNKALNIKDNEFIKDVSTYPCLNDLYIISDLMISDYSSTYFDYSILDRPMFCFAYDLEEYEEKRGLYLNLYDTLPCNVMRTEDELIDEILNCDYKESSNKTKKFHERFAPYAGNASSRVVDEIERRLNI